MYDAVGAFTAGLLTSSGPCVAPRFAAVAGLSAGRPAREAIKLCAGFCAGLVLGYGSFAAAAWIFQDALRYSHVLYAAVACMFGAAALAPVVRKKCRHAQARSAASAGAALLLGASLAFVVSPCCTPVILALTASAAADGNAAHAAVLLAWYATGHALPLLALAGAAQKCAATLTALATARAGRLVTSGVMLALALYYAVLA